LIKSVITAAGQGTRLLPITKEMPKEMMPIFTTMYNKERVVIPLVQFIFEQLYSIGIRDYCFVVRREKRSIENHFTPHKSYLNSLSTKHRKLISSFYQRLENSHLMWVNQKKPMGFGDAVRKTEKYVGNDDFVLHGGDVSILTKSKYPILRLINTAKANPSASAVLLCKKISDSTKYGVPTVKKLSDSSYLVQEVIEKPTKPKSNLGILALYYFRPQIFTYLKKIKRGVGNEYQLTDAIQGLIESGHKVLAITLQKNEIEIDVGTVESYRYSQEISYKLA